MPLGPGVRYRVKTNPGGSKMRLAFRGNKVVEAKKMGKGKLQSQLASHIRKSKKKR